MVFVKIFQNLSPIISNYTENQEIFNLKQFSKFAVLSSHVREDLRPSHRDIVLVFQSTLILDLHLNLPIRDSSYIYQGYLVVFLHLESI